MALPSTGQLSLSAIRDEFGAGTTSNVSLRTLSSAAGLSVPDGLNEFYGLSAYTLPYVQNANGASITGAGTQASPYTVTIGTSRWTYGQFTENYYECEYGYTDGIWYWRQAQALPPTFAWGQSGSQRAHWNVTAWGGNLSTACGTSYAVFDGGVSGSNTYRFGYSFNNTNGATQMVGYSGNSVNTPAANQTFTPGYAFVRQSYREDIDWDCDGSYESVNTYPCNYQISTSLTFTLWFELI